MGFDEMRRQVVEAVQEASGVFNDPRFVGVPADPGRDLAFETLDIDSLSAMDLCVGLEERTGVEVDLGDLVEHPSINALARALAARAGRGSGPGAR